MYTNALDVEVDLPRLDVGRSYNTSTDGDQKVTPWNIIHFHLN